MKFKTKKRNYIHCELNLILSPALFQIAVNPFKYNALLSFLRILGAPKDILQQFINIMTFELVSKFHISLEVEN